MSRDTLYTCDVCGKTAKGDEARDRWRRVTVLLRPLERDELSRQVEADVCSAKCAAEVASKQVLLDLASPGGLSHDHALLAFARG